MINKDAMASERFAHIKIAVSSCLLGNAVRYDGQHKSHDLIVEHLCTQFQCIAICPEVAIGMGVPRHPIRIVKLNGCNNAIDVENTSFNVTQKLLDYAATVVADHPDICGYIFKARSPSCGVNSTPVADLENQHVETGSGIFAARIRELMPDLPVIEEDMLTDMDMLQVFQHHVVQYFNRA